MFTRHDARVKVVNAGVGGYRSVHEPRLYVKVVRHYAPDIVTLHDGWNDFEDYLEAYWRPKDPHRNAMYSQLRVYESPLSRLALGHLLVRSYYAWKNYDRREVTEVREAMLRRYMAAARDSQWLDEYEENLQEVIDLSKRDGVIPVLVLFPSPHFAGASDDVKRFADADLNMWGRWDAFVVALAGIRGRLHRLADHNGIPLIDVNGAFERYNGDYQRKFEFFTDRMHLTYEGERLIATTMYPCLEALVRTVRARGRDAVTQPLGC
jgi:lysophospholipase L1-like esterase